MTTQAPPVIETDALTKRFGSVVAVDHLSLRVERGGVFGLLGPNGSGKTTTIGMLLGLVAPSSGSVRLFGRTEAGVRNEDLQRIGAIGELLPLPLRPRQPAVLLRDQRTPRSR